MTRPEINVCLTEKLETAWAAYRQKVLQLPSNRVYAMAHEIHATRTCYEELVYNAGDYPVDLLERLLALDDPLETAREQWIRKENEELSERLGCVLRSIWEPEQNADMEEHNERTEELDIHSAGGRTLPGRDAPADR